MKKTSYLFFVSVFSLVAVLLTSCARFGDYSILNVDGEGRVGIISYARLRYLNPLRQPVKDALVKLEIFDEEHNEWKNFKDALNGNQTFRTDENGDITFAFLPDHPGILRFRMTQLNKNTQPLYFSLKIDESQWGFLIWLASDNDLESYSYLDVEEMKTTNKHVFLLVMWDKYSNSDTEDSLMFLDENGDFKKLKIFDKDVNSGDPGFLKETLRQFYSFDVKKRALVIWDHGNSWIDDSKYHNLAVGYDFTSQDALTTKEIREAIEYILNNGGEPLDLLGFDACNMSSIEIAFELRNSAKYFVASAFPEPAFGWDYSFLSNLNSNTNIYDLAKSIVDKYFEFYRQLGYTDNLSLGVYNLTKINSLIELISEISTRLLELVDSDVELKDLILEQCYPRLLQYYPSQEYIELIDPLEFLNILTENIYDPIINTIKYDFIDTLHDFIVYKKTSSDALWLTGLGLYFPNDRSIYESRLEDMQKLEFYEKNPWKNFLEKLLM